MKSLFARGTEGKTPKYLYGSTGRYHFLDTLPPTQTTGSPFKLLQQRLLSDTTPTPLPHPLTSYLVSRPPPNPHFLRGQDAISIFLSPTAISQLFTGTTRIKRDNLKIVSQQLSGWGGGGAPRTLGIFFFLSFSKGKIARIIYLFQSVPQQFTDRLPGSSSGEWTNPPHPQFPGQGLSPAPKKCGFSESSSGCRSQS